MGSEDSPDLNLDRVDEVLSAWRQGDCVLGEQWFAHRFHRDLPATEAGHAAAKEGDDIADVLVRGLVVVSQTCDIVRKCRARPYVEVCPLVEVGESDFSQIKRGNVLSYAYVPGVAGQRLVAHLDRVMTVEKPLVSFWERIAGCSSDAEIRTFSEMLARKRARFAFPDDFNAAVKGLSDRISKKHDKGSPEGNGLRALREIRVAARPYWGAEALELFFWFIRHSDDPTSNGLTWDSLLKNWLALVLPSGRFKLVKGLVVALEDMTASEYVDSDRLDLDYLSSDSA